MITLENRQRRLVHFAIPIAIGGGELHNIGTTERAQDPATRSSSSSIVVHARRYPTTLTLAAAGTKGSTSDPVADAFADAPEIAAALKKRTLVLVRLPAPPPAEDPATPSNGPAPSVE